MSRSDLAARLGVTPQAVGFWIKQGWMTFERQTHIQYEFPRSGLMPSWNDVPPSKRPAEEEEKRAA